MGMAKNGILLAIGGMLGAFVAAVMTNDEVKQTAKETAEACKEFAAMDRLIDKLRIEGEAALKVCTNDEEREAVYEKIRAAVTQLKEELQEMQPIIHGITLRMESICKRSTRPFIRSSLIAEACLTRKTEYKLKQVQRLN